MPVIEVTAMDACGLPKAERDLDGAMANFYLAVMDKRKHSQMILVITQYRGY